MLKCLIVEDEPIAAEIIAEYIAETPFLTLVDICHDAISALDIVQNHPIDVIFLDINLPKLSGIDFIKTLRRQPKIIITSAYDAFAVEGFALQVVDYLLKPIEFSRFTKAVQKLLNPARQPADNPAPPPIARPFYYFNVQKRQSKIFLDEIQFIESLKDSVVIITQKKEYLTHYQLGELEDLIHDENLMRIHRSFIVAIDKIDAFTATEVEVAGRVLPIGRSFKIDVMEKLGRRAKIKVAF
jgi:DNA-binding LytR/AlgR family response regulator